MSDQEYFISDNNGNVVWRYKLPPYVTYTDPPTAEFISWENALELGRVECLAAAFRLGLLPRIRHHAQWDEVMSWPVESKEDGNFVVLHLPMGDFRLRARRAKAGELTSDVLVTPWVIGTGRMAAEDQDSLVVRTDGRVCCAPWYPTGYAFQVSHFEYADGTRSGFMGAYPMDIERV